MPHKINHSESTQESLKKRILFVITQSEFGGAQRFLHTLVTRLDRTKYEILVAAGPSFGSKYDLLDLLEKEEIKTLRLKYLKREISPLSDIRASFELRKASKKFKPDTLFLLSSKAGFIGSFVSKCLIRNTEYKILYRIGGWTFNDPWPKWKKLLWIIIERISAKWKDLIIVNNKHDFEQANQQSGRVFQDRIIIGTIANFYPTKGLGYLIETAEYFKNKDNIVFMVIGDGPERASLENLIKQKGLQKKIIFLGQIPDAHKLLSAFDIFVLPSIKEGFPWVVIEAMAAKLPVVATRVGAVPEIIE